jgi:hypothetical protein
MLAWQARRDQPREVRGGRVVEPVDLKLADVDEHLAQEGHLLQTCGTSPVRESLAAKHLTHIQGAPSVVDQ